MITGDVGVSRGISYFMQMNGALCTVAIYIKHPQNVVAARSLIPIIFN